jgi:hypothetical protein
MAEVILGMGHARICSSDKQGRSLQIQLLATSSWANKNEVSAFDRLLFHLNGPPEQNYGSSLEGSVANCHWIQCTFYLCILTTPWRKTC